MLEALLDALMPTRVDDSRWEWVPSACDQLETVRARLGAAGNGLLAELAADTAALGRRIGELRAQDIGGRRAEAYNRQAMLLGGAADLTEKIATGDLAKMAARLDSGRDAVGVVALVALSFALARAGDMGYVKSAQSAYAGDTKALLAELRQRAAQLASWKQQVGEEDSRELQNLINWAEPALDHSAASPDARAAIIALFGLAFSNQIALLKRASLDGQSATPAAEDK